jgi:gamma-glutamyl phosphate reductase
LLFLYMIPACAETTKQPVIPAQAGICFMYAGKSRYCRMHIPDYLTLVYVK